MALEMPDGCLLSSLSANGVVVETVDGKQSERTGETHGRGRRDAARIQGLRSTTATDAGASFHPRHPPTSKNRRKDLGLSTFDLSREGRGERKQNHEGVLIQKMGLGDHEGYS